MGRFFGGMLLGAYIVFIIALSIRGCNMVDDCVKKGYDGMDQGRCYKLEPRS